LEEQTGARFDRLDAALEVALADLPPGVLVVLFSGGVDSGLLAWELRARPAVTLSTFGLAGSADVRSAASSAPLVGLPWHSTTAGPEEVRRVAAEVIDWVGPLTATELAVETSLALAMQRAAPGTIVCGQGIDELFFGYAHYRGIPTEAAVGRGEEDLARLLTRVWPREREIARRLDRTLVAPYLDGRFVDAARAIPPAERLTGDPAKAVFRAWARHRGLPEELVNRPKKALQYGSGVARLLRKRGERP
jgi:asparagine synthase (glutamine-hydrolysing)